MSPSKPAPAPVSQWRPTAVHAPNCAVVLGAYATHLRCTCDATAADGRKVSEFVPPKERKPRKKPSTKPKARPDTPNAARKSPAERITMLRETWAELDEARAVTGETRSGWVRRACELRIAAENEPKE